MAKRVIALLGQPIQNEDAAAAEAVTPGMLVTLNSSGLVIKHAVVGGLAPKRFAMERDEMGNDIDVAYAIGDTVKVGAFSAGMRVNALIADTQNIAIGDMLESAGDGTLRKVAGVLTDSTTGTANTTLQAIPDPTDAPATADALRDDIVANDLPAIRNNFADLAARLNGGVNAIAMALEAVNNTSGANARLRVELI